MSRSYDYDAIKQQRDELHQDNERLRADLADRIQHTRVLLWAEVTLFLVGVIVGVTLNRGGWL